MTIIIISIEESRLRREDIVDGIALWMRLWLERIVEFAKTPPGPIKCGHHRDLKEGDLIDICTELVQNHKKKGSLPFIRVASSDLKRYFHICVNRV